MGTVRDRLPDAFWNVPYVGARYPGSAAVAERPGLADGANCQLFAYEVLGLFGLEVPPLRSSELWEDRDATVRVSTPRPLDLILFNRTNDPWGAHVGVHTGDDLVLHLSAEAGYPKVWPLAEFAKRERYRTVVGIKRVRSAQERSR